ncbi:MAG: hypothetical protein B0A82_21250 [Alkalinema sp. CACIAM 70d]|nr:MAG: hypothetical protein B0A82_21250 [Alkalinema sp. CACIAM 70d]
MPRLHPFRFSTNTFLTSVAALIALQSFVNSGTVQQSLLLEGSQPAIAAQRAKYNPPNRPTPIRTDGTGVRSSPGVKCGSSSESMFLSMLAPVGHTGETVNPRPTLYAYFTGKRPIEMRFGEVGKKPLFIQRVESSESGFIPLPYPSDQPELQTGKTYQWSVEVVCNPKKSFENVGLIKANLQRVEASKKLENALAKVEAVPERSAVYADAGLWYDAVDTLAGPLLDQPKNKALKTALFDLLEQGGLKKTVEQDRKVKRATGCHGEMPIGTPRTDEKVRCPQSQLRY